MVDINFQMNSTEPEFIQTARSLASQDQYLTILNGRAPPVLPHIQYLLVQIKAINQNEVLVRYNGMLDIQTIQNYHKVTSFFGPYPPSSFLKEMIAQVAKQLQGYQQNGFNYVALPSIQEIVAKIGSGQLNLKSLKESCKKSIVQSSLPLGSLLPDELVRYLQ